LKPAGFPYLMLIASCLIAVTPALAIDVEPFGTLSGSYRNLLFAGDNPAGHFVQTDVNRLRLEWNSPVLGNQSATSGRLNAHLAYDHEFTAGGLVTTPAFQAASRVPEATWLDAEQSVLRRGRMFWRHHLYRAWLNWEKDDVQFKLGRQRIAWGSGRMWNPTDRFNPVDPTALEGDQKIGVDSALGEWRYSSSGIVQAVAAPGSGAHLVSRKTAVRVRDTFGEADVALLGGRMGIEQVLGADIAANLLEGGLHGEWLHARPAGGVSYHQLSAGYEYTLMNAAVPEGLYLLGEYFFNGAAGRTLVGATDRLNSTVRHLAGFSAGYDLTPLLRLDVTTILDMVKGSSFVAPKLTYSLAQNLELSGFAYLFSGHAGSEFGPRTNLYIAQFDAYF